MSFAAITCRHDERSVRNFLLDPGIAGRIAEAGGDLTTVTVFEIGPGPGGLTRALLATGARRVVAIERDPRCVAALAELAAAYPDRLVVHEADALAIEEAALADPPRRIVANLPYNVATPLLFKWLGRLKLFQSLTLMFQKEVAARIAAEPRSRSYGRLAVMVQWQCDAERLFDLPPGAFTPAPKVHSTLIRLTPRPKPLAPADGAALERVVATAFNQRRKMLRSALKPLGIDVEALLAEAGISPRARAEELDVAAFCALARAWQFLTHGA